MAKQGRDTMNFNNLDLNLLRVFDAIFQTRSVTLASSNLHLTQPAVSKQLNRLRELLEDPLFVRTNDGMAPTPRAEAIAGAIRQALADVRNAVERQLGFDPSSSDRTFRIFMNDAGQMVLLPRVLALLAQEAPSVNIQTVQMPTLRMRSVGLESGDVDLAVGYFEEFDGYSGVVLPARGDAGHSWHMFQVLIDFPAYGLSRAEFQKRMAERGIGVGVHYPCIPGLSYYRGRGYDPNATPVAARVGRETVTLPLFPAMSNDDVSRVCWALRDLLR